MNRHPDKYAFKVDSGGSGEQRCPVLLPRVNVVVTCFNYGQFVGQALDSVAAQTYVDFDCVVVDDASTDNSAEIVEWWIANTRDTRFRLIRNERNLGQMGSFVAALAATEGEFVAFLDADDVWFPEFLTRHIEVHLNRAQPAGASCSDLVQVDANGRALVGSTMPPVLINTVPQGKEVSLFEGDIPTIDTGGDPTQPELTEVKYVFANWGTWYWSVTSGMVFRRPLVELLIPANAEPLRLGADLYLMALGHCFAGSFVIRNVLGAYRRHGKNSFSSLPVFGSAGSAPVAASTKNLQNVYCAMLQHMLAADDRFSQAFSPAMVRKRARSIFRLLLLWGVAVQNPRLSAVIGWRRVASDRIRAKIGILRQKVK
jgi:glycosyltransferase involved in cell wall biosynthesis